MKPAHTSFLFRHFGRITSGGAYQPVIDGVRCIAILGVLGFHLSAWLVAQGAANTGGGAVSSALHFICFHGSLGVQLFFVLSGYILALPFVKQSLGNRAKKISLKAYYVRRLSRLEPPYVAALLGLFFAAWVMKGDAYAAQHAGQWVASLFYLNNALFNEMLAINPVIWSLEVEVQFYVLCPLLALIFKLRSKACWLVLVSSTLLLGAYIGKVGWGSHVHIGLFLPYFLAGFCVALAQVQMVGVGRKLKTSAWFDAVCAALCAATLLGLMQYAAVLYAVLPAVLGLFVWCILNSKYIKCALSLAPVCVLGGMCYSIYLLHFPLISFVGKPLYAALEPAARALGGSFAAYMLCVGLPLLVVVIAVCAAFFKYIERPCMRPQWYRARLK